MRAAPLLRLLVFACFAGAPALVADVASAQQPAAALAPPSAPPDGVYDGTASLDADTRRQLASLLDATGRRARARLGVALVPDTGGRAVDAYGLDLFRAWRLGDDTQGRGVLLVVAVQDRTNRIVVGSGLRDRISDDASQRILTEVFRPAARASGVGAATLRTVVAIRARLAPPVVSPAATTGGSWGSEYVLPFLGLGVFGALLWGVSWRAKAEKKRRLLAEDRRCLTREYNAALARLGEYAAEYSRLAACCGLLEATHKDASARFDAWRAQLHALTPNAHASARDVNAAHMAIEGVRWQSSEFFASAKRLNTDYQDLHVLLEQLTASVAALLEALKDAAPRLDALAARWPTVDVGSLRSSLAQAERDAASLPGEVAALSARLAALDSDAELHQLGAAVRDIEPRVRRAAEAAAAPAARYEAMARADDGAASIWRDLPDDVLQVTQTEFGATRPGLVASFAASYAQASSLREAGDPLLFYAALLAAKARLDALSAPAAAPSSASYSASEAQFASDSSDCASSSSDCASSASYSSDCASSDCSDCASSSSDCGGSSSDCASSSSDCGGSSSDW